MPIPAGAAPAAEPVRIATFNVDLSRKGPGLLARDLARGGDAPAGAAVRAIGAARPDILLLTGFDYDMEGVALGLFARMLAEEAGLDYPHRFAARPNTGWPTGLDMDGDGRLSGPGDAQGWGRFSGAEGMAVLSRWPVEAGAARDFSGFLWRDLPGALIAGAGLSPEAAAVQRLSSTAHWAVPVRLPGGRLLTLLTVHATPPVFDGPEDRNGRRNHDELRFWELVLDGWSPGGDFRLEEPFVLLGDFNLDPADGDGRRAAARRLLTHPRLADPAPRSARAAAAAASQGGANLRHRGDPALDTADWRDDGPGNMRVDYVLPSATLAIRDAGVEWPPAVEGGPRHGLVWVAVEAVE